MIKAVFLDYTGTILQQRGPDMDAIVDSVIRGSTVHDKVEFLDWWHKVIRKLKAECYQDTYLSYDDLLGQLTDMARMDIRFKDSAHMRDEIRNYWMYAPVYDDAREFFDLCPLPVYVLCSVRRDYAAICLRRNNIHVNGIISADEARAYAPHAEFYERGLNTAGCKAEEALYVSEDPDDCIPGARKAGMQAVLLDRKSVHRNADGKRVRGLVELMPMIQTENGMVK